MGLAERRAGEDFKNTKFADFLKKINEIAKFDIELVVNWDELTPKIEGQSDLQKALDDYFFNCFGTPFSGALSAICIDNTGREAFKSALKRVVFKADDKASSSESGFTFENGELCLNMKYSNTSAVNDRVAKLTKLLESKL